MGINYQLPITGAQAASVASYAYSYDAVGNRIQAVEWVLAPIVLPTGAYLESGGLVVMEAEHGQRSNGQTHNWLLKTSLPGYTGTSYLQSSPDIDTLIQTGEITTCPRTDYVVNFTTPATYTLWLRGYPTNAAGDSVYVGLDEQRVGVTGFVPGEWSWANATTSGVTATLSVTSSGLYTVNLLLREDGLRIDRLLLTTDTTFLPAGFGPAESYQSSVVSSQYSDDTGYSSLVTRHSTAVSRYSPPAIRYPPFTLHH